MRQVLAVDFQRFPRNPDPEFLQLVRRVISFHEADQRFDQGRGPASPAHQVVDVVEPLGEVIELAPRAAARCLDHAATGQAREVRAAFACIEPRPVRDFARRCRFPEVGEGQIDAAFLGG